MSFVNSFSLLIFVAVILSMFSLLFITFFHLTFISWMECFFFCIDLSHLKTQIRWLALAIRILNSLVLPLFPGFVACCLFLLGLLIVCTLLHPPPLFFPMHTLVHFVFPFR